MATQQFIIRTTERSLAFALHKDDQPNVHYDTFPINANVSLAANLREAFNTNDLLRETTHDAVVTIDTPILLLPTDSFRQEDAQVEYLYAYPDTENAICRHVELPSLQTVAVFAVNKDLSMVLADHFVSLQLQPTLMRLWTYLLRRDGNKLHKTLYAYFYENKMHLCAFHRHRFVFANTFRVDNTQDATYYILAVWQQINFHAEHDVLVLSGQVPNISSTTDELHSFIPTIHSIVPSEEFPSAPFASKDMPLDLMVRFV